MKQTIVYVGLAVDDTQYHGSALLISFSIYSINSLT